MEAALVPYVELLNPFLIYDCERTRGIVLPRNSVSLLLWRWRSASLFEKLCKRRMEEVRRGEGESDD